MLYSTHSRIFDFYQEEFLRQFRPARESSALGRSVRPRRGEDDNGRDGLPWRRPGWGGWSSTAVDYRHAKILNETNTQIS